MPTQQTKSKSSRPGGNAIARAVTQILGAITKHPSQIQTKSKRSPNKRKRKQRSNPGNVLQSMPANLGGRVPRGFSGMSDIPDFTIAYNAADIVLGGGTGTTAPGTLGTAYWLPRANSNFLLTSGLLPVAPSDNSIGRSYVTDLMKHYTRRVITRVRVIGTSEQSNTTSVGLFAIAASRGGSDAIDCTSSVAASLATNSDTDIMTMKNPKPFRVYDNFIYDATWAIAGGTGPKQNEFNVNRTTAGSTVVGNLVDGSGLIPCCIWMGGSSSSLQATGQNVVTHRVIIEVTLHLLDYRGSVTTPNPQLEQLNPMPTNVSPIKLGMGPGYTEEYTNPPNSPNSNIITHSKISLRSSSHK
jgi:hypothetical protein